MTAALAPAPSRLDRLRAAPRRPGEASFFYYDSHFKTDAVKVLPGSFGTFAGLRTNACAQVLAGDDRPVEGLYAVGTDMASIMAGHYPSGGINLGPAMTFGYIAGRHAAMHSASP